MGDFVYPNLLSGTADLSGCHYPTTSKISVTQDHGLGFAVARLPPTETVGGLIFDTQDIPESERVDEPICTLSFMARADVAGDRVHAEIWGSKYLEDFTLTTEWQIFSMPYGFINAKLPNVFFNGIVGNSGAVYMALPMAVRGTTPAAWAPAEGETLPGGGALMSANLLEGIEPILRSGTTESDGVWHNAGRTSTDGHDDWLMYNLAGQTALTTNQTYHVGLSTRGASANPNSLHATIGYRDAAGNVNWVNSYQLPIGTSWGRAEATIVVSSGMTPFCFYVAAYGTCPETWFTFPTLSYGSSGPILASDSHTPYATQDHVKAVYATNADIKIWEDAITYEVSERTKLDGRVGTLESTSSEHTSKITQLSSSIESMVKGEATYTAPDGTTKTNGLYSKIEQTASGINETFGQYTKTADLASTAAVRDAKKAGTDAASAASAAQSTADAAKANAATAQTTANTAVTNASAAQSTADAAKTAAANAQSTADAAKGTADNLATLIRKDSTGVTVGYTTDGTTFTQGRTHMSAESFDVLDANGGSVASFGKTVTLGSVTKNSGATVPILSIASEEETLEDEKIESTTLTSGDSISLWATAGTQDAGKRTGFVEANRFGANVGAISEDSENIVSEAVLADVRNGISLYTTKGVSINAPGIGGTHIKKRFAGTSVVNSLGSDFDLFSGDDCKSRFGELIMPDNHASWVLLASPGQGSYDHHITLSPTSTGGVHGYITPSVKGNIRVQWIFIKF